MRKNLRTLGSDRFLLSYSCQHHISVLPSHHQHRPNTVVMIQAMLTLHGHLLVVILCACCFSLYVRNLFRSHCRPSQRGVFKSSVGVSPLIENIVLVKLKNKMLLV